MIYTEHLLTPEILAGLENDKEYLCICFHNRIPKILSFNKEDLRMESGYCYFDNEQCSILLPYKVPSEGEIKEKAKSVYPFSATFAMSSSNYTHREYTEATNSRERYTKGYTQALKDMGVNMDKIQNG